MTFSSVNERELRRRKADLEALTDTARKLEDASDPSDIATLSLLGVADALGFERGLVLAAPSGRHLELLAFKGKGEPLDSNPESTGEVVATAWETHSPQLVRKLDPESDERLSALLPFAENVAVVPLFAESEPIGVLVVENGRKRGGRMERRILTMVGQFASHASLALRNAWLLEEVQKLADTDALTGIANRRTFESVLERELSRAKRNGEQVTLVMMDIDHFKKLNDNHGHQTGDEVLRQTGHALAQRCRDFDTPARYGGEEFAVILPACSPSESLVAADRLRKSISEMELDVPVTASAGVATFPTHASDVAGLVKAADEALYESKRSGRNRVTRSRRTTSSDRSPLSTPE
jgi:diguanylate cyclase (GGDEF)-like protein